jgi:hypothetical protein
MDDLPSEYVLATGEAGPPIINDPSSFINPIRLYPLSRLPATGPGFRTVLTLIL